MQIRSLLPLIVISFSSLAVAQNRVTTHLEEDIFPKAMIHIFKETNKRLFQESLNGNLMVYQNKDLKNPIGINEVSQLFTIKEFVHFEDPFDPMKIDEGYIDVLHENWISFHFIDNYVKIHLVEDRYAYVSRHDFNQIIDTNWARAWKLIVPEAEGDPIDGRKAYETAKEITQKFIENLFNQTIQGEQAFYRNDSLTIPIDTTEIKESITHYESGLLENNSGNYEEYAFEVTKDYYEMAGIFLRIDLSMNSSGLMHQYKALSLSHHPLVGGTPFPPHPLAWISYSEYNKTLSPESKDLLDLYIYYAIINKLNPRILEDLVEEGW